MTVIVLGYRSHRITDDPTVIYCGGSGSEADEAVAAKAGDGFARMTKLVNPIGIPVRVPEAPVESLNRETVESEEAKPAKKAKNR